LLNKGSIVLSDRYFSSTIAFQCAKSFNYKKAISITSIVDIIIPDLTIFIHILPEITFERKFKQKGSLDRHEKNLELLNNVNIVYEKMMNEEVLSKKWVKINGNQDLNELENDIKKILETHLPQIKK